ncbi:MAG: CpsB/CapC family capsule biosynthesis tyrosine phosphatase [Eubacteriales bacterium]
MSEFVDIHNHILPRVDDGAKSMEESVAMLYEAVENEVKYLMLTPHSRYHGKLISLEDVNASFAELEKRVLEEKIPIQLKLGMEIYYEHDLLSYLKQGKMISLNHSSYLLVEFHNKVDFQYMLKGLYDLSSGGYIPILAHAERYPCLFHKKERMQEIKERDVLIQVNAGSVLGKFGRKEKIYTKYMLKNQLVDYVATDAHDLRKRKIMLKKCEKYISKWYGKEYASKLFYENGKKLFE